MWVRLLRTAAGPQALHQKVGHSRMLLVSCRQFHGKNKYRDVEMVPNFMRERVTVKSYYVAQEINLTACCKHVYKDCPSPTFQRDCLVIRNPLRISEELFPGEPVSNKYNHIAIFHYGSVVFFNFSEEQQKDHLKLLSKYMLQPIPDKSQRTDDHMIAIWPESPMSSLGGATDTTVLKELSLNNVTVISAVMAQTVALDHYGVKVEGMMKIFSELNNGVGRTGMFTAMDKQALFKLVAETIRVSTDLIMRLRFLDRSDTAWKNRECTDIWEALREEFELEERFRKLEIKIDLMQRNTKFFLEILHNQKSDKLEWTIIILILAEIVVGVCDLLDIKPMTLD